MKKVCLKVSVFMIGFCILCSCGNESANQEEKISGQPQMEETTPATQKQNPVEKKDTIDVDPVLEEFGRYLQNLIVNGERKELDSYIISNRLTWEEAARRAENSCALSHFADYGNYKFNSDGAIIVEADVNGDGTLDMIEYLPNVGSDHDQNSLTIYEGMEDGTYEVMLYEPFFPERVSYYDKISVAGYQQNIFLILEEGLPSKIMNKRRTIPMCAYQIKDEKLQAKINLEYVYADMIPEVVECKSSLEEESEKLCEKGTELFLYTYVDELFKGSAEEFIGEKEKDVILLEEKSWQEMLENIEKYQPLVGDVPLYYSPAISMSHRVEYRSDLNNDGVKEIYAKHTDFLGMEVGTGGGLCRGIVKTGEDKFDKEYGLKYTLLVNGQRTEIEKISGLNLWGTEYIPQMFWVDTVDNENIVYISYINEEFYDNKIEAYLLKGDSYERVMAIKYTPRIECSLYIDPNTNDSEPLRYTIHLVKNNSKPYLKIYGLEDASKQQVMNQTLNEMVQEKINLVINTKGVEGSPSLKSNIYSANDNELIIRLIVLYRYVDYQKSYSEEFPIKINLIHGEIEDVELD